MRHVVTGFSLMSLAQSASAHVGAHVGEGFLAQADHLHLGMDHFLALVVVGILAVLAWRGR